MKTLFLLRLGLRTVLVEKLEGLSGGVLVEGIRELSDGRRDLETHVEDLSLALESNVFRPFDHAREVAPRLDVLTDTKVARTFLDKRVLLHRERLLRYSHQD